MAKKKNSKVGLLRSFDVKATLLVQVYEGQNKLTLTNLRVFPYGSPVLLLYIHNILRIYNDAVPKFNPSINLLPTDKDIIRPRSLGIVYISKINNLR